MLQVLFFASVVLAAAQDNETNDEKAAVFRDNIANVVQARDDLTTLYDALESAGFVSMLEDQNVNYTLFAPTNAAFSALGPVLEELLSVERATLAHILDYHVAPNKKIVRAEIQDDGIIATLAGRNLTSRLDPVRVVDDLGDVANLIEADVLAANGVVHVVDAVLVPKGDNLSATAMEDDHLPSGGDHENDDENFRLPYVALALVVIILLPACGGCIFCAYRNVVAPRFKEPAYGELKNAENITEEEEDEEESKALADEL
ncbi:hypothetical protein CTAYLR_008846 [Chrysophaeum taylorii]|uniref:FAS1 domain-containing protein n=1 Tax=Chrysophaeum taylorii TaxID=2483200 RepID=A0AAD7XRT8_9STRA|nr:hypothetical protein CTAYLR_008846 [Chrysophaeum taylorii]